MIRLFFANPGAGKTTLLAKVANDELKRRRKNYEKVYANFPLKGAHMIDVKDLGVLHLEDCLILIDEGGLEFNNRKMKMSDAQTYFFKMHRHYNTDIVIVSQSYDDIDITIRRLYDEMYLLKRSIIQTLSFDLLHISSYRRIRKRISIDEESKQIVDAYNFFGLPRFFNRRKYYHLFDSWDAKTLKKFTPELWSKFQKRPNVFKRLKKSFKYRIKQVKVYFYIMKKRKKIPKVKRSPLSLKKNNEG